jgi:hypothetical protein
MTEDVYTFHINAYSPETIPMSRLAEYMAALAEMLGEKTSVHFVNVAGGSTKLNARVEQEAVPKVRDHVTEARANPASSYGLAYKRANEMLRSDNADAELQLGGADILEFPGRRAVRPPKLGPFQQPIERDGVLVRIGGKDRTAHAIIEDPEGATWSFEVSRALAVDLARHLFGSPIRIVGTARWLRDENGAWVHNALKGESYSELDGDSLETAVLRIRDLSNGHWVDDPLSLMGSLRNDDKEAN